MDLRLLVLKGKPQGKELPIRVSPFIIGRGPECQLRPNSDMVSRLHCALTIQGDQVNIRDLGSTNGTIVDGERLTGSLTLTDGDIFQVGPLVFQVVLRAVGETKPATSPVATPVTNTSAKKAEPETANVDDIVQWLVSDTKNEIPTSGSGVFAGKTVFTPSPSDGAHAHDAAHEPASPELAGPGTSGAAAEESHDKKKPNAWPHGGAAHAAEDMIRNFLERRPRQHK